MIHCLEIIETKKKMYELITEKHKRKMDYIKKNNP